MASQQQAQELEDVQHKPEDMDMDEEEMLPASDSKYIPAKQNGILGMLKKISVYIYVLAALFCFVPCLLFGVVVVWKFADFSIQDILHPKPIEPEKFTNNVILISLDGFRHDYLEMYKEQAPTLWKLVNDGVRAERMNPIYPSLTFPNHYSLVTGLYAESHGIVGNTMWDPTFKALFRMGTAESFNSRWWQGEPIWITAEKQGVTSGCVFWVGSDLQIQDMMPTYWKRYDDNYPNIDRVDTLLSYFEKPKPARMTTIYFSDVDHEGHSYGPNSVQVRDAVKRVDDAIARLVNGLEAKGLSNRTDVIIVSDHGMTDVSVNRIVLLENYINMTQVKVYMSGPIADVWVQDVTQVERIYQQLQPAPNMTCYKKQDLPERYHYQNNVRIGDIICVAKIGWSILRTRSQISSALKGAHGFDNLENDMGATFIAYGPSFNKGKQIAAFDNVHVYSLLSHLLHIKPAANNGTTSFWVRPNHALNIKVEPLSEDA